MILYIYSKCSTCQKALKFLEQNKLSFIRREITDTPPSLEEIQTMLNYQQGNLKKLFNTSGQLYQQLELSKKLNEMTLSDSLKLLSQHGMLVKRPFLIEDSFGLIGFKEDEWKRIIL